METHRQPVSFVATDNPDAAQAFYADVMGLELREAIPFALVFLENGHTLRVQIVPDFQPVAYTVHGWEVADIAQSIKELSAKGVQFRHFDQLTQDALGVWTTPDGSQIAWFSDPSGNTLSLTQHA